MNLKEFLEKAQPLIPRYEAWIQEGPLSAHLRISHRRVGGSCLWILDLANVSVLEPERKKGHFKAFMIRLSASPWSVYVESVDSPIVRKYLEKSGYVQYRAPGETDDDSPHYYKIKEPL